MKRFLLKIGLFLLIVAAFDVLFGKVFSYMAAYKDKGHSTHVCDKTDEDVLIFGSSRAMHHYNPTIISDSLGFSCYNCGEEHYGIILAYAYYQLICQRYHPKVIIYDLFPAFDTLDDEDNHIYLGKLRPYYNRNGIPEIIESVDSREKYKMVSQLYRYNSSFLGILLFFVKQMEESDIKGFRPVYKENIYNQEERRKQAQGQEQQQEQEKQPDNNSLPVFDSLKIDYFKKMLEETEDVRFIFVVSPILFGMDSTYIQPVKQICQERGIPLLDYSNSSKYLFRYDYFVDNVHLNDRGADEFTRDLVQVLKERGVIQPK